MTELNLGRVVGFSALDIYNKVNGTSLTESEFAALIFEDKRIFTSKADAIEYTLTPNCKGGQLCKVLENGKYYLYIVQPTEDGWELTKIDSLIEDISVDYKKLKNLPTINGKLISGDTDMSDFDVPDSALTNADIENLLNGIY